MNGHAERAATVTDGRPTISTDLEEVHKAAAALSDSIERLVQRIEHTMRPSTPHDEQEKDPRPELARSPLSGVVRGVAERLYRDNERVDDMLSRLEL